MCVDVPLGRYAQPFVRRPVAKLLDFINTNDKPSLDCLYGRVSQTGEFIDTHIWSGKLITYLDLHEARAILLGRSECHDQLLEAYV